MSCMFESLQGYGVELDLNWKDLQDNGQVIKFAHGNWSLEKVWAKMGANLKSIVIPYC